MQKKLSNAVWEDQSIIIRKDGYRDIYSNMNKEVKPVNLVCGVLIWWVIAYCTKVPSCWCNRFTSSFGFHGIKWTGGIFGNWSPLVVVRC